MQRKLRENCQTVELNYKITAKSFIDFIFFSKKKYPKWIYMTSFDNITYCLASFLLLTYQMFFI